MNKENLADILNELISSGYDAESFIAGSNAVVAALTSPTVLERLNKPNKRAEDFADAFIDMMDLLAEVSSINKELQELINAERPANNEQRVIH